MDCDLEFGRLHFFRYTPHISALPESPGIYCVYTCQFEGRVLIPQRLVYIGSTGDSQRSLGTTGLRTRVKQHDGRWDDWQSDRITGELLKINGEQLGFTVATCWSRGLVEIETAMIFKHQPPLNKHGRTWCRITEGTITTRGNNPFLKASFSLP
jgi:hypothetical protein